MRLRTRIATAVGGLALIGTSLLVTTPAQAQGNPPCYAKSGHLYCGNTAGAALWRSARYSSSDKDVVDVLKSNPSYFECYVSGQKHGGGNKIWYRTYGDNAGRTGYLAAESVYTSKDPFPGVRHC
ncbi:hypothetical protein FAF44_50605 [Nonomuraea sp. MG754425]|uniref:hypothetical protein n=1 Tax=Nonomuraea sp. MG754425 TaxID=2570319 RepID=UPI001F32783E|nr:hypothetical protein [Nonomuraea sp. MG754425]MCF6476530.1 hypothetical protein [Nonomuraea sp. MG754425]